MKGLNELAAQAYEASCNKGFYDKPVETGTRLMLIVSEVSEALEADRRGIYCDLSDFDSETQVTPRTECDPFTDKFERHIKDTFEDEIADTFIRLLDLCGFMNIDIERHIALKMQYNSLRSFKHGKSY